jgi:hypothetical protein
MPFQSEAQRRFMWSQHPDIAQRWTNEYGSTPVKHPGFKAISKSIQSEGYSPQQANAILASKTMHASASAKKANPRLNRVAAAQRRIKRSASKTK